MDNNQENNIKDNENPVVNNKRYGRNKLETFDWLVDVPAVGSKQCNLVEVQFKNTRKGYYLNSLNLDLSKGDIVAVESAPGHDIGEVTLLASQWVGENNLYSQVVEIEGTTEYSQVDITPDVQQLAIFYEKDITFVTENEDGAVTVFVIGQKPENDYTIQVTITEVNV